MRHVLALCLVLASPALAHTSGVVEEVCPLDGTKFKAELDMSGTSFGKQLDLKPVGPTAAPFRIAICPTDGFVLYKQEFTEEELADFKAFVATADYKGWVAKKETSHYLLARLFEHRGAPVKTIAWLFLQASWQVDEDAARYPAYAAEALTHYATLAQTLAETEEQWTTAVLVSAELERRLGRFEDAEKRLRPLLAKPAFETGFLRSLCEYELKLVAKKDTAPHQMNDASEEARPTKPAPKKRTK